MQSFFILQAPSLKIVMYISNKTGQLIITYKIIINLKIYSRFFCNSNIFVFTFLILLTFNYFNLLNNSNIYASSLFIVSMLKQNLLPFF